MKLLLSIFVFMVVLVFGASAFSAELVEKMGMYYRFNDNGVERVCTAFPSPKGWEGPNLVVCFMPNTIHPLICAGLSPEEGYIDCKDRD